jgi:tetratricopeptide (TPR) repeat protein
MIARYRRWPSILVLLVAAGLGTYYLRSLKAAGAGSGDSLEQLEKQIAQGHSDAKIWYSYAQRLTEAKRFEQASLAYRKVLDKEPSNRQAKFGCALSLAQAGNADEFYNYMHDLAYGEAKLAIEIFDRRECQPWLKDARFAGLQKEAKAQAMD